MSEHLSEALLIEQAKQDPTTFRLLYPRYVQRVYAYATYKVGTKQDVEDIVSETFLRALEHIENFEYRGELSFRAWLIGIARLVVLEFYRQKQRTDQDLSPDDVPLIQHTNFEGYVIRKEQFLQVYDLLQTLPARRQEIIIMRFFGGLRNKEIAEMLNISDRTVSSHLSRGLDELQSKFQEFIKELQQ